MRVEVLSSPRSRLSETLEVGATATVEAAIRRLGLHPDAVLVVREGDAVPLDAPLQEGDRLKILSVFSGG